MGAKNSVQICIFDNDQCSDKMCENQNPPICINHAIEEKIIKVKKCFCCETPIITTDISDSDIVCEKCQFIYQ